MRLPAAGSVRSTLYLLIALLLTITVAAGCDRGAAQNQASSATGGNVPPQPAETAGKLAAEATPIVHPPAAAGTDRDGEPTAASGETAFVRFAPFFREPMPEDASNNAAVWMYGSGGAAYNIAGKRPEWIGVDSYFGTAWVPEWYVRKEGEDATEPIDLQQASYITVAGEAQFHLFPGSSSKWPAADWEAYLRERTGGVLALLAWSDWFGVILPPAADYDGSEVNRSALLWLRKSDVTGIVPAAENGWMKDGRLPVDTVRYMAEVALLPGIGSDQVRSLLGEPDLKETSGDLDEPGKPMRLGTNWIYERADSRLTVTFSKDGRLVKAGWTLPFTKSEEAQISNDQYPSFSYEFRPIPLAATGTAVPDWSAGADLPLTYLYGSAGNTLLLFADDGGFSGMHYDSNLFAVDRQTGKKLWQIDAGYDEASAVPDSDGKHITVYTRYNSATKREEQLMRRMRLSDGKIVWQKTMQRDSNQDISHMTGASGVIVTYFQPFGQTKGGMSVWDAATGKLKWQKAFGEPFSVLSRGEQDSFVLLLRGSRLEALDPDTGHREWKLEGQGTPPEGVGPYAQIYAEPAVNPLAAPGRERWILLGNERILVDTVAGKALSRYTAEAGEDIEVIDNRHWIVRKPLDTDKYWTATRFESEMYDAIAGKALWTVQGRASGAAVDDDGETVYMLLENGPAALRLSDGRMLWKMDNKTDAGKSGTSGGEAGSGQPRYLSPSAFHAEGELLLLAYGADLLSVDKHDGKILYRMPNIGLSYPDSLVALNRSGLINQDADYLYVGSSNGCFYRLDKDRLLHPAG